MLKYDDPGNTVKSLLSPQGAYSISATPEGGLKREGAYQRGGLLQRGAYSQNQMARMYMIAF